VLPSLKSNGNEHRMADSPLHPEAFRSHRYKRESISEKNIVRIKKEFMTPKLANTEAKLFGLKRDNVSTAKSWMLVSEKLIVIANQKKGEERTGKVVLTKKEFERFIKFYETGK
jgi:hypothetical protein